MNKTEPRCQALWTTEHVRTTPRINSNTHRNVSRAVDAREAETAIFPRIIKPAFTKRLIDELNIEEKIHVEGGS